MKVNVWVHCHCGKGRLYKRPQSSHRSMSQNFLNENLPWTEWKYFRRTWRQVQESVLQMVSSHAWNSRISYAGIHTVPASKWAANISKTTTIPFDVSIMLVIKLCCQNFWADWWAQLRWHCEHTDTRQSISCAGREMLQSWAIQQFIRTMTSRRTESWITGTMAERGK